VQDLQIGIFIENCTLSFPVYYLLQFSSEIKAFKFNDNERKYLTFEFFEIPHINSADISFDFCFAFVDFVILMGLIVRHFF
jgi:hypothetical protein